MKTQKRKEAKQEVERVVKETGAGTMNLKKLMETVNTQATFTDILTGLLVVARKEL